MEISATCKVHQEGYAVLEDFLRPEEVDELKASGEEFTNNLPPESQRKIFNTVELQQNKDIYFLDSAHKINYFFEAEALEDNGQLKVHPRVSLNKVGHALHWIHPTFKRITFDERIKEIAFQLNFQEPAVCQSMYIYKNPGLGSEVFNLHNPTGPNHMRVTPKLAAWPPLPIITCQEIRAHSTYIYVRHGEQRDGDGTMWSTVVTEWCNLHTWGRCAPITQQVQQVSRKGPLQVID
ncbi:hypothetical protein PV327_002944 [Microctonus hyperodae]|uniref:Uncharacterized protein n=1 Tax=Microctonus hyperodae TaxID=165561 RepID=A0AA39G312_MICHY|nr:hypothetical protein PV327_002944 [Microctonus hyperodae]